MITAPQEYALRESRTKKMFLSRRRFAWTVRDIMKRQSLNYSMAYRALDPLVKNGFLHKATRGNTGLYMIHPSWEPDDHGADPDRLQKRGAGHPHAARGRHSGAARVKDIDQLARRVERREPQPVPHGHR